MKHLILYLCLSGFILSLCSCLRKKCESSGPDSVTAIFVSQGGSHNITRIQGIGNSKIVPMQNDSMALLELKMHDNNTAFVIEQAAHTDTILFNTSSSFQYQGRRCGYTQSTTVQTITFTHNGIDTVMHYYSWKGGDHAIKIYLQ